MDLRINGDKHIVPTVRELTASQFIDVIIDREIAGLKEYLSVFSNIPVDEFNNAEIKTASLPALHANIFNADVEAIIRQKPNRVEHRGISIAISHVEINTYGSRYYADRKRHSVDMNNTRGYLDYCLYILALGLTKEVDPVETEKIYNELLQRSWVDVVPAAFFLAIRYSKMSLTSRAQYLVCILELKRVSLLIRRSLRHLIRQEKKQRP